jgi:hypothetical protein
VIVQVPAPDAERGHLRDAGVAYKHAADNTAAVDHAATSGRRDERAREAYRAHAAEEEQKQPGQHVPQEILAWCAHCAYL